MRYFDWMHRLLDAMHIGRILSLAIAGLALSAQAQVIDRVDVQRVGNEAEVTIRFVTPVQYLRHSPPGTGNALNIYFQLQRDDTTPVSPETKTVPRGELASGMSIHYPEPDSSMLVNFPESTSYRVRQGRDNRSIIIQLPAAPGIAKVASSAEAEKQSRDYLAKAKSALERNDATTAVENLNLLLNLPPTASYQEAQELMGSARERNGELAKARAEYELYLKLYPEGPGAARVRERLAAFPLPSLPQPARRGVLRTPAGRFLAVSRSIAHTATQAQSLSHCGSSSVPRHSWRIRRWSRRTNSVRRRRMPMRSIPRLSTEQSRTRLFPALISPRADGPRQATAALLSATWTRFTTRRPARQIPTG